MLASLQLIFFICIQAFHWLIFCLVIKCYVSEFIKFVGLKFGGK